MKGTVKDISDPLPVEGQESKWCQALQCIHVAASYGGLRREKSVNQSLFDTIFF